MTPIIRPNDSVHPAAASDFDSSKRAIGGSACNALFCDFCALCVGVKPILKSHTHPEAKQFLFLYGDDRKVSQ